MNGNQCFSKYDRREETVHEYIRHRCVRLALLFLETGDTVRAMAKKTGYSKSTIHKDLTERLKQVNEPLSIIVNDRLQYNKSMRHIRGGEATKQKWQQHKAFR